MTIEKIIEKIRSLPDCRVYPPLGLPKIKNQLKIPTDVIEFYEICGGVILNENAAYSVRIVPPQEVCSANYVIIGEELINSEIEKGNYDKEQEISEDWYIIADLYNSDYLVIDFNSKRKGLCYKAFWDSYPEVGSTPIIARSFTELLNCLVENDGDYWYFLKKDYVSYGDAYD